jgi:hypothetical protein
MIFFHKYIELFAAEGSQAKAELAKFLSTTRATYDIFSGGDPMGGFNAFVDRYNWLGVKDTKTKYGISENLARNLPGAMMQDYLLHFILKLCGKHPTLDVFTEVKVAFGRYPVWREGNVTWATPSERSDIAVGYRLKNGTIIKGEGSWPRPPYYTLPKDEGVLPLITINSKIRVSQSEFFDWHGREQLMTKGNPHCLSIQVVLRKEMDLNIVEAAQAGEKFFLLGGGGEKNVVADPLELARLSTVITSHLDDKMLIPHPSEGAAVSETTLENG